MSEYIPGNPEALCEICNRPWRFHADWKGAPLSETSIPDPGRADFDAAVAVRTEELVAFEKLVRFKAAILRDPNQTAITRPRDPHHDALEIARVHAYENAKAYQQLVQRRVQDLKAARGNAESIQVPKGAINRRAYFASKDAPLEGFETRDAFS